MKRYTMIALLFVGVLIGVVAGCDGSAPGLNPDITFKVTPPTDTTLPILPTMLAGGTLIIEAEQASTSDATNPIIRHRWAQETTVPGVFLSTDTAATSWRAPQWAGPGELPVTLIYTADTLLGGHTEKRLELRITPVNQ